MRAGLVRILVLIGVAALLGNAQCYTKCVIVACGLGNAPTDDCHHQKSSHRDPAPCQSQYSDISSPEAGVGKIGLVSATLPLATQDSRVVIGDLQYLTQADTGPPPGSLCCATISVLRI
jgi:hypothetical protein